VRAKLREQPVAIGDPRRLDLNRVAHGANCAPPAGRETFGIVRPDGGRDPRVRALHRGRAHRAGLGRAPRPERTGNRRTPGPGCDGERAGRRPRGRRRPRRPRRRLGQDPAERALAPPARLRRRARRQPQGAGRARDAQRRQGDLVGQGRAPPGGRELPLLRLRDRLDCGPLKPDRRLAPLLLVEGARRRLRPDRPLELPADDDDVEAGARPRRGLHDRAQARLGDTALRAADGRARDRGRLPARDDQRRARPRPSRRRVPRQASRCREGRLHRLDRYRRRDHAARLRRDQAPDPRARREEPEPGLRRRGARRRGAELGLVDLLLGRPELRGALARACRGAALRRLRLQVLGARREAQRRRPARSGDAGRLADLARAPRPRPRPCPQDQGGHRRDQHAVHRLPGDSVRRLQAVRLRPRARARDPRAVPRDEERDRLDEREAVQPLRAVTPSRYRWLVLAAGTAAQTSYSAVLIGLPVLAPQIRHAYGLSLVEVGLVLDSVWIGGMLTLLPWGLLADRAGERIVLALGLGGCAAALVGAAYAGSFGALLLLLGLAGAAGASVNAASGRAVMYWFP